MYQLIMNDLYDLLARRHRFCNRLPGGFFLDGLHKITRDAQRDIRLKQGNSNLAQRCFNVVFGQRTLFGQPIENTREAFGQVFKH